MNKVNHYEMVKIIKLIGNHRLSWYSKYYDKSKLNKSTKEENSIIHDDMMNKLNFLASRWIDKDIFGSYSYDELKKAVSAVVVNHEYFNEKVFSDELKHIRSLERHLAYKNIQESNKLDCEANLTRQNLKDLFNSEFAPFLSMNFPQELREKLREKHNQKNIDDFVNKVWGYVQGLDFQVFHIEMALSEVRGTKFTFEKFMKALVNSREFADNFNEKKEDNISKCKQYINQLNNKSGD